MWLACEDTQTPTFTHGATARFTAVYSSLSIETRQKPIRYPREPEAAACDERLLERRTEGIEANRHRQLQSLGLGDGGLSALYSE